MSAQAKTGLAQHTGSALFWRAAGQGGVRVIALIRTVALAWVLAPNDFGLLAIAWLTVDLASRSTRLGMRRALIHRDAPNEIDYDTAWSIELLRMLVAAVVVMAAAPAICEFFRQPEAVQLIRLFMAAAMFDALGSIGTVKLARRLVFRPEAIINVASAVVLTIIAVAFASRWGPWAVGVGVVIASALQMVLSYVIAPYRVRFQIDWSVGRELFAFGGWILVIELLSIGGATVLQAIVGRELGTAALGIYYLATRLVFVPRDVLRGVAHDVMFPLHVRLRSDAVRAGRVFRGSLGGLSALVMPCYAILVVLAPALVADVFGPEWAGAERVLQLLSLSAMVCVLADVTLPLLEGRGRPQASALVQATRAGLMIALASALTQRFGVVGAGLAWLLAEIAVMFAAGWLARGIVPFHGLLRQAVGIGIASGVGVIVAYVLDRALAGGVGVLVAAAMGLITSAYTFHKLDHFFSLALIDTLVRAAPRLQSSS